MSEAGSRIVEDKRPQFETPAAWLDAIERASAAATPGEWRWDPHFGEGNDTALTLINADGKEVVGAYNDHCCEFRIDPDVSDADAAAIVAAHNALPALLAIARGVLELADEIERHPGGAVFAAQRIRAVVTAAAQIRGER